MLLSAALYQKDWQIAICAQTCFPRPVRQPPSTRAAPWRGDLLRAHRSFQMLGQMFARPFERLA
jgi:hypothetical protein